MNIEITGAGFVNHGAQLMLLAARERIREWPGENLVGVHLRVGTRRQRREAELVDVLRTSSSKYPVVDSFLQRLGKAMPAGARRLMRSMLVSEVELILDASGFAYGDEWGPARAEKALAHFRSRETQRLVLLPQAFGPFEDSRVKRAVKGIVDRADLVFARDEVSLDHLRRVVGTPPSLHLAPDFTNLLNSRASSPEVEGRVILVPNARVFDKGHVSRESYLELLVRLIAEVEKTGNKASILVHEDHDLALARELKLRSPTVAGLIVNRSALALKGALGTAKLVVSSRYHALVGAMAQGTPALALGWSHKYGMLMRDYGATDSIVNLHDQPDSAAEVLSDALEDVALQRRRASLVVHAERQRAMAERMWQTIESVVGL